MRLRIPFAPVEFGVRIYGQTGWRHFQFDVITNPDSSDGRKLSKVHAQVQAKSEHLPVRLPVIKRPKQIATVLG